MKESYKIKNKMEKEKGKGKKKKKTHRIRTHNLSDQICCATITALPGPDKLRQLSLLTDEI